MRKSILALVLLPLFLSVNAQSLIGGKNIVKVNLTSLALGDYNFTYERKILPHITASLGISKLPTRNLPFKSQIQDYTKSSFIDYDNATVGNFTITPELRLYLIGAGHGLYVAPYGRYTSMDLFVPLKYDVDLTKPGQPALSGVQHEKASFSGTVHATSGGLMVGTQFQLLTKVVLDIWIVGAHYGSCDGDLTATYTPLDQSHPNSQISKAENKGIQDALNTLDPSPFKVKGTLNPNAPTTNTADIRVSGPWVGVRALGINVGIRF